MRNGHAIYLLLIVMSTSCKQHSSLVARMADLDTGTMLALSEAVEIAEAEVPEGFVVEALLEVEGGEEQEPPAYEVILYVPSDERLMGVEVHSMTGEVLEIEVVEDGGESEDP